MSSDGQSALVGSKSVEILDSGNYAMLLSLPTAGCSPRRCKVLNLCYIPRREHITIQRMVALAPAVRARTVTCGKDSRIVPELPGYHHTHMTRLNFLPIMSGAELIRRKPSNHKNTLPRCKDRLLTC